MHDTPTRAAAVLILLGTSRAATHAIRSLGHTGLRVAAAVPLNPSRSPAHGLNSRFISEVVSVPDPAQRSDDLAQWLEDRLRQSVGEIVLPIDEAAIAVCAAVRRRSDAPERFVMPSDVHLAVTLSKVAATREAERLGIAVPRFVVLRESADHPLLHGHGDLSFPLVVKWDNHVDGQGIYRQGGNAVARDAATLEDILAELEPVRCAIMVQEFAPGRGVGAFFLRHGGTTLLRFAHRRLHEVPWSGGVSSLSESSNDPLVIDAGERLLAGIGYQGVAMVEFRQEPGRQPVFLEVNGRLWGSLGLALQAGVDFPRAMVEAHLKGTTSVVQPALSRTVRCRNLSLEMDHVRSVFHSRKNGDANAPSRLRALASLAYRTVDPGTRSDLLWLDDPVPGLLALRRVAFDTACRLKSGIFGSRKERQTRRLLDDLLANARRLEQLRDQAGKAGMLFLCYGNICRSPYALARWNTMRAGDARLGPASSAGFHERADRTTPERFLAAAARRGINLAPHRSSVVTADLIESAGLIVVMDVANAVAVRQVSSAAIGKTVLLRSFVDPVTPEIADPYGQPLPAGAVAYRQIDIALRELASRLTGGSVSDGRERTTT